MDQLTNTVQYSTGEYYSFPRFDHHHQRKKYYIIYDIFWWKKNYASKEAIVWYGIQSRKYLFQLGEDHDRLMKRSFFAGT